MPYYGPRVLPSGVSPLAEIADRFSEGYGRSSENRRRRELEDEQRQRQEQQDMRRDKRQDASDLRNDEIFDIMYPVVGGEQPQQPPRRSLASQYDGGLDSLYDDSPGVGQFPRERPQEGAGIPPQLAGLGDLFDRDSLDVGGFREGSGNRPRSELDGSPMDGGDEYGPGLFDDLRGQGMPQRGQLPKPALPGAFVLGQGYNLPTFGQERVPRAELIARQREVEKRQREDAEETERAKALTQLGRLTPQQIAALRAGVPIELVIQPERKPPQSRQTDRGIEEWDSESGEFRPTGRMPYRAPQEEQRDTPLQRRNVRLRSAEGNAMAWAEGGRSAKAIAGALKKFYPELSLGELRGVAIEAVRSKGKAGGGASTGATLYKSNQEQETGKGEAPDDVLDEALARFDGDEARAAAYLRSLGYN